jgi:hypothetical protein
MADEDFAENRPRVYITKPRLPIEGYEDVNTGGYALPIDVSTMSTRMPMVDKLFGLNGQERYQTWPEKMVREAVTAPGDVLASPTPMTSEQMIAPAQAIAGMAGGGSLPGVMANGLEKNALGIVPVAAAKKLKVEAKPPSDLLKAVAENTEGTSIDADGHLIVNMVRSQHPDQEMAESVRGGVFYLPKGDKNARHYNGTTGNNYGGAQAIEGETAFKNPLLVKGATGGKAPEAAYNQLMGDKKAYAALNTDVMEVVSASNWMKKKDPQAFYDLVNRFLDNHAPEMRDYADYILDNSKKGNQLRYALSEAAIASAARKAGHDGILGYSELRGANSGKQRISEIYDVRENRYPSPSGDYNVHPQFLSDSAVPGSGIQAVAQSNAPRFYSAIEKQVDAGQPKMSGDQWLSTLGNKPGVKPDELTYTGLADFLQGKKSVTREEIQAHLKDNKVEIGEVVRGTSNPYPHSTPDEWQAAITRAERARNFDEAERLTSAWEQNQGVGTLEGATKYDKYQLPGGENYREVLMTLPENSKVVNEMKANQKKLSAISDVLEPTPAQVAEREALRTRQNELRDQIPSTYKSSHWDEPNILAHMRMNDRTIDGKKSLHLEEVQSDWGQQGRKEGYESDRKAAMAKVQDLIKEASTLSTSNPRYKEIYQELPKYQEKANAKAVPDMPFKKNWHELALKRAMAEAAEKGYDRLSWTAGEHHPTNPKNLGQSGAEADAADKGMRGFYDNILPKSVEKLTGQKVQKDKLGGEYIAKNKETGEKITEFKTEEEALKWSRDVDNYNEMLSGKVKLEQGKPKDIHYIDIPQSMRESIVGKGQPLFSAPPVLVPYDGNPFEKKQPQLVPVNFNPFTNPDAM